MSGAAIARCRFLFTKSKLLSFRSNVRWSLAHLLGYLRTWSATQRFVAANERDPVELVESDLERAWGNPTEKETSDLAVDGATGSCVSQGKREVVFRAARGNVSSPQKRGRTGFD